MLATTNSTSSAVEESTTTANTATTIDDAPVVHHSDPPLSELIASTRRRRRWIIAAVALALAGGASAVVVAGTDDDATVEPASDPINAVSAETRDLAEFDELDGRLVDANIESVGAPADGIVTTLVSDGATVERGDVLLSVNGVPATVFHAEVPLYRPLEDGTVGDDVRMLEENLAALGYHTIESDDGEQLDDGFVVDDEFDDATEAAVERWQEDVGAPVTGIVAPSDVVVADGPSTVERLVVETGDRVTIGAPVVELAVASTSASTHLEHSGDIDLLVADGDALAAGDVVYTVDGVPVTVLVGDDAFDRDLELDVEPGDDVRMLEEMLAAIGYDAGGDLIVDDRFDEDTERAVENWQEDLANAFDDDDVEVEVDGEVSPVDVFVVAPDQSVGSIVDHGTDVLAAGSVLWTSSAPNVERVVETSIEVSEQDRLALGAVIDVEFPTGEIVRGTVTDVADSTTTDPMDPDAVAMLGVEIELDTVPDSIGELNEVDVTVKVVDELVSGAVVVPASSLVAVGDGTFAVEALTTTGTILVPVTTGMFSDGWVEVSGVQPGVQVVTP